MVEEKGGFETPCAGDVADGVTSSAKDNEGTIKCFDEFDATCVSFAREIEDAETIASEGIGATL
jgi:hypothetical protein